MDSNRLQKVARLIQKDMGLIFQSEARNLFNGAMITPTSVRVSADLSIAKVYVSIFALGGSKTEDIFELIDKNKTLLRMKLAALERHQLRVIPSLSFFIDDSLDYSDNIERLLKE
jgi:ribosome-binding factor A